MDRTVLVTGASRGIGAATARVFAQEGWQVAMLYRTQHEAAAKLVSELEALGVRAAAYSADVASREQARDAVHRAEDTFGGIDTLVNNAGIAIPLTRLVDYTEEQWDRVFNVNLRGMFHCIQAVLPGMTARHSGAIVNVSSIWGITGGAEEVPYSATKGGVVTMTRALAKEVGPDGIRVNCVAPGIIDTDMNAWLSDEAVHTISMATPLRRLGHAEEVAQAIWFLGSERASFITGQLLSPNGGYVI
ncbi:MAG: SDR family oxidoreductase [Clostridiales bacterium]|nr:SDR family oxidoreductase [Clostridiales bacterium]